MRKFEILLPFGLPTPHLAPDLLRELKLPALSTLLAKAAKPVLHDFDPFSRMLPHEVWISKLLERAVNLETATNSPPLTVAHMKNLGLQAEAGYWFILHPVHIHIARDHLVLTDNRRSILSEEHSRALFESVLPSFAEAGKTLCYGNAATWFVRADDWCNLQTATPDAACGHNVDIWMPKGDGERAWRKLQNEVQMTWHEHAVNDARAEQGLPPINSLWLWAGADASQSVVDPTFAHTGQSAVFGGIDASGNNLASLLEMSPQLHFLVLGDLCEAALAEDWAVWLERMHALELAWFAPVLAALRSGELTQVKLIIGHHAQLREFTVTKSSLLKFWAKPSLTRLLP
ncbi:MAG TPA: hypothetical protein VNW52_04475 [Burkholderiaceae bacterium]|jgi:hypothetical protein|nr:hypothetical protein [Burkholderiaceae bacterium]